MELERPRWPKVSLGFLVEQILAISAGLAQVRALIVFERRYVPLPPAPVSNACEYATNFLAPWTVVMTIGLFIEACRGRKPLSSWGIGRQSIAIAGLTLIFFSPSNLAAQWGMLVGDGRLLQLSELERRFVETWTAPFYWIPPFLAAVWLVMGLTRRADGGPADVKEWLGRILAVALWLFYLHMIFMIFAE